MLTRFCFISCIQGCSIILHGVARRLGSFSRLRRKQRLAGDEKELVVSQRVTRTHQHSIKYLKLSLQKILESGSSLSLGMGCLTM